MRVTRRSSRALWKGVLNVGRQKLPVKMYSALQDHAVHFRLLSQSSHNAVHQRIIRKNDGEEVAREDQRKAYQVDSEHAVILTPEELDRIEPEASRGVDISRFVPGDALNDQWYDRPYYLGPDGDNDAYFALVDALERRKVIGIAHWAMRQKRYLGALSVLEGHLMLTTLRRADQVLSPAGIEIPESRRADEREIRMAEQLVESISEDEFEPEEWKDKYQERVRKLIEAKARGKKVAVSRPRKKPTGDLVAQLEKSLRAVKERKVA